MAITNFDYLDKDNEYKKNPLCYLCKTNNTYRIKGAVRDDATLKNYQCQSCGLVFLSSNNHVSDQSYINSAMHGDEPPSMEEWIKASNHDDERRFNYLKKKAHNKTLLDIGCGAGGFLLKINHLTKNSTGIELEDRVRRYWSGKFPVYKSIDQVRDCKFDLITIFHVLEHLKDPVNFLRKIKNIVANNGTVFIEVPNSKDALINIYDSEAYQEFIYWSQHLFVFSSSNIKEIATLSGFSKCIVKPIQRYGLSNHLNWLRYGIPGGNCPDNLMIDTVDLNTAYESALALHDATDTLWIELRL
jgi:SAM-dependent methyltransferase